MKPEDHDYQAAVDYLSMLAEADAVEIVAALRAATPVYREANRSGSPSLDFEEPLCESPLVLLEAIG